MATEMQSQDPLVKTSGQGRPPGKYETGETPVVKPPQSLLGPAVLLMVVIAVVTGMVMLMWSPWSNPEAERRENLSKTADAALTGRLTDDDVDPLVGDLTVTWQGDKMFADFVLGGPIERECHVKVLVSADQQRFGFNNPPLMTISKLKSAEEWCRSSQAMAFGLPLEEPGGK